MNAFCCASLRSGLCLLLLGLFVAAPVGEVCAEERVVNVAMEDQFRNPRETAGMRGDVVVLLYADRHGAEEAHDVGRKLHLHFHPTAQQVSATEWNRQPVIGLADWPADMRTPNVHAVAVACLPEIPKPVHPVVRAQVRKESPHVPVWLDFAGTMPKTFGMVKGVPNILLIDTAGRVHSVTNGSIDDAKFKEMVATIDQLRQQARPAIRTASNLELAR